MQGWSSTLSKTKRHKISGDCFLVVVNLAVRNKEYFWMVTTGYTATVLIYYREYGFDGFPPLWTIFIGFGIVPLKVIPVQDNDNFFIQSVNWVPYTCNLINKIFAFTWLFLLVYFWIFWVFLMDLELDFVYLQLWVPFANVVEEADGVYSLHYLKWFCKINLCQIPYLYFYVVSFLFGALFVVFDGRHTLFRSLFNVLFSLIFNFTLLPLFLLCDGVFRVEILL